MSMVDDCHSVKLCAPEMITIQFDGWMSGRIVSF